MRVSEIRERSDDELTNLARQLQDDLYTLRVHRATNQLENTASLRLKKRDLARVLTVLQARQKGLEQGRIDPRAAIDIEQ